MLWTTNRIVALVLGALYALLGIIGFFTPVENGTGVQAVLGLFDADTTHNIIRLVVGALGIIAAFTKQSRAYNQGFSIFYILLTILGLIPALYFPAGAYGHDTGLFLGLFHINNWDHGLNLIAAIVAGVVGFFLAGSATHPAAAPQADKRVTQ